MAFQRFCIANINLLSFAWAVTFSQIIKRAIVRISLIQIVLMLIKQIIQTCAILITITSHSCKRMKTRFTGMVEYKHILRMTPQTG